MTRRDRLRHLRRERAALERGVQAGQVTSSEWALRSDQLRRRSERLRRRLP